MIDCKHEIGTIQLFSSAVLACKICGLLAKDIEPYWSYKELFGRVIAVDRTKGIIHVQIQSAICNPEVIRDINITTPVCLRYEE